MPERQAEHVSFFAPAVLRRFLLACLLATLVFSGIITAIYRQNLVHRRVMLEQEAQHVLEQQQEFLLMEFRCVQSDLLYLASQERVKRFVSGEDFVRDDLQREYVSFALNKGVYDQIRCLDTDGQEIIRVNYRRGNAEAVPRDELQSKATRYYYRQALSLDEGQVLISPFDLNVEHGHIEKPIKPVIRFLTPVCNKVGEKGGILVLNYLGAHLLSNLKQVSAGFRGATMLINPAGEYLQAPDPASEWGWLLGHERSFRSDFPSAWDRSQQLESGPLRVGQNLFTFQRVSPARRPPANQVRRTSVGSDQDPSSLILVSYISSSVAQAPSRQLLRDLMLMYGGVMAVVVPLSLYWSRSGEIRRYHERQIADSESRLRQLSSLLLAAQETERRNLSRGLHDELGQQVTAISLDLRSLEKKKGEGDSDPLLRRAIAETNQLLRRLHEIARRVRPSVLDDLGLRDAVESMISEYQERTGIKVSAHLHFRREKIPGTVGENVYRIVQEALANVAAHAQVDRAEVTIKTDDDVLRMTVRDAGSGFDPAQQTASTRLGILGMRERVELLNGRFELQTAFGQGTRIDVSIPLGEDEDAISRSNCSE